MGFCNITIPKSLTPIESTPIIFIDDEPAQNQGYTQDQDNYYVWYIAHFSTHQIAIVFTALSPSPSPNASDSQSLAPPNLLQVIYGVAVAAVIVTIVLVTLKFAVIDRQDKVPLRAGQCPLSTTQG